MQGTCEILLLKMHLCLWAKTDAGMGSMYRSQHELIIVFKHGKAPHRNNIRLGQFGRFRSNLWQCPGSNCRATEERQLASVSSYGETGRDGGRCHPRLFPPLGGGIVLDSSLGSGTTPLAAERTGQICHGIELDPQYVDTAVSRWQSLTGKAGIAAATSDSFSRLEQEVIHATTR